ncbi:MAG: Demethylmenaquinone methyltransferase [Chlamydiales bacterium]|nr:Demethylmenaquinone methyltransferase [Chlamydiales bacterium]MCH9620082.1 Demethylmenaquinone methyltransferase [Chlamydiales bacterium]MCH9623035.1 Demethylmenaquinone methyltransferase [Chlamydiales bacterium]
MYSSSTPSSIKACFAEIAKGYDRSNSINSLGLHHTWNQKLVELVGPAKNLLDLCAGTGEIALRYCATYSDAEATLLDFCPEMLEVAREKSKELNTLVANAEEVPLPDNSFDVITIAYGIRNVNNRMACFQEAKRLMKPGGRLGILELTRPHSPFIRPFHRLYTTTFLPLIGRILSKNSNAYRYLSHSIQEFISPSTLSAELEVAGLKTVQTHPLAGGIATIIIAEKCYSS